MPSVVDMIAGAEKEAEQIRFEADARAKEIVSNTREECERAEKNARDEVKKMMVVRGENARNAAARLSAEIMEQRLRESENNCTLSERNLDKAAKYIIERVTVL